MYNSLIGFYLRISSSNWQCAVIFIRLKAELLIIIYFFDTELSIKVCH